MHIVGKENMEVFLSKLHYLWNVISLFRISHPIFYDLRERLRWRSWAFAWDMNAYRATYSGVLSFAISCWRKCFPTPLQAVAVALLSALGGTVRFTRPCHLSEMTWGCCFPGGWFVHVRGSASSYLPPSALTTAALSRDGFTERLICYSCNCPSLPST